MRSKIVLALCIVASVSIAPGCGDDENDPDDSDSGASGSGAGVAGAATGGAGAAGTAGGAANGGDGADAGAAMAGTNTGGVAGSGMAGGAAGAGDSSGAAGSGELFSCAATPCGSGNVCLSSGSGAEVTESCVEDPCAPATLDCSCASELCRANQICLIQEGGVVCASR